MRKWSAADIPDLNGRTAVVTGASNGIGFATALELARKGALVILAVRDHGRGEAAAERIRGEVPDARLALQLMDLSDLETVEAGAARIAAAHPQLDLLINNAGVMMPPPKRTAQGHEQHFGVNYLAHFVLTLTLLPRMAALGDARVVTVSSLAHRVGRLKLDDLSGAGRRPFALYAQSKLADACFAQELDRRLRAVGSAVKSVAAHPGFAGTHLAEGINPGLTRQLMAWSFPRFGQTLWDGALPTLFAATAPSVQSGSFFGPDGIGELAGAPRPVRLAQRARDPDSARALWELSEALTGLTMPSGRERT